MSILMKKEIKPSLTVLMSVYNGELYIKEAVESILNQTFRDFEFVIIDDGSTDNTFNIISQYSDKRLVILSNPKNMGLSYSLNRGIEFSNAKYIARMDADDIANADRLKIQYEHMKNHNIDICGSWFETFGDGGSIVYKLPVTEDEIRSYILFDSPLAHPTVMFKREHFIKNRLYYNNNAPKAEDYELWSRVLFCSKIENIPQVLLKYRRHSNQEGQQYNGIQIESANRVREYILKRVGIKFDRDEFELHCKLSYFESVDCKRASDWLTKLVDGVVRQQYCKEEIIKKDIGKRFWIACNNKFQDSIDIASIYTFFDTPIHKYAQKSLFSYIKIIIKSSFLLIKKILKGIV